MSQTSSAQQFLEWVDRHKAALGLPKATDRFISVEATGNADAIRSVRRNVKEGKQHGVSSETIRKFEKYFGEPFQNPSPSEPPDERESPHVIRPSGPEPSEVVKVGEGWPDVGEETMDVRGVVVGGDDSFFYFGDVIDRVRRPPGIRNAKNVAALNVAGESMVPRFKSGELIYVQQRLAAPGDDVVVELYPEHEGDAPKAFLKEMIRRTGRRIYCKQHNPPSDIEFDAGEVKTVWRVLTMRDLLG